MWGVSVTRADDGRRSVACVAAVFAASMLLVALAASAAEPQSERPIELAVRHTRIAALGGEHIAHAIYRRTTTGGSIVGWGERVVQWPLDNPQLHEVVPR